MPLACDIQVSAAQRARVDPSSAGTAELPADPSAPPLTFCDVSTFYSDQAGGVRTYYRAKGDWFAAQSRHRYVLVHPGERFRVTHRTPTVTHVEVFGKLLKHGYRLILDVRRVAEVIRDSAPDVLETGDPWVSGPFGLVEREVGSLRGVLASFYHSDPVETYLRPWALAPGAHSAVRARVASRVAAALNHLQRMYDCTVTASAVMMDRLRSAGIRRVFRAPFGVDPVFLEPVERVAGPPRRLLYAGRLSRDKGIDVLLRALPALLELPGVTLTVIGRGPYAPSFADLAHQRVRYLGFAQSAAHVRAILGAHDLLLAPGPFETFGLGVLEALAMGLVVIGPDAGGAGELLRELGSPFVFPAGDADALVERVRAAVSTDCSSIVRAGRDLARQYGTWPDAIARLVGLYQHLHASRWQ